MARILLVLLVGGVLLLAGGYTGRWLPLGDSLAVGRIQVCAGLLVLSVALWAYRRRVASVAGLVAALIGAVPIAVGFGIAAPQAASGGSYMLYQKNLLQLAWPRYPLADEIIESGAGFVTLQEVSAHNLRFMKKLFEHYPTQHSCEFRAVGAVVVMSHYPMVPGTASCGDRDGLTLMQVVLSDARSVWLASLHLHWPYPHEQAEQLKSVTARLKQLDGPVVLGGDFNMVPWGYSVKAVGEAAGADRFGSYHFTFPLFGPLARLPIDHVLLPPGATGRTETRSLNGSDHKGIVAVFDF